MSLCWLDACINLPHCTATLHSHRVPKLVQMVVDRTHYNFGVLPRDMRGDGAPIRSRLVNTCGRYEDLLLSVALNVVSFFRLPDQSHDWAAVYDRGNGTPSLSCGSK